MADNGVERQSWIERRPVALCHDDGCPWKKSFDDLERTQRAAEEHVRESGHGVRIYRELRRDVVAVAQTGTRPDIWHDDDGCWAQVDGQARGPFDSEAEAEAAVTGEQR